jgi:hypothetical protein
MNITEAQAAKAGLERAVLELLAQFSADTGLKVTAVNIDAIGSLGCGVTYVVEAEVQL